MIDRRKFIKKGGLLSGSLTLGMAGINSSCSEKENTDERIPVTLNKKLNPLGIFLASHNQDTGMKNWDIERWKKEIDDIKKMGANTIWYLPIQFGQKSPEDFKQDSEFWQLQIDICRAIKDADLNTGIYIGYNDIFPDQIEDNPEWEAEYGKYGMEQGHACLSVPEAVDMIMRLREKVFKDLPRIDYLVTPITDYGGCSCDKCAPLTKTYLRIFSEQHKMCKKFHPEVKAVAAGHGISFEEEDELRELMKKESWISYIKDIPRGVKPIIKYYMSPEITMAGGWGRFGAYPLVSTIKDCYMMDYPLVAGAVTYSEGIHDDVNKFSVLQFAQDPNRTAQGVARQYAEEWLNMDGEWAGKMAKTILNLGNTIWLHKKRPYVHPDDGVQNPLADKNLKTLIEARAQNPFLSKNFRYWLLHFRAVHECFSIKEGKISIEKLYSELKIARKAFLELEPAYGKYLEKQSRWIKPESSPMNWARTFHYAWNRENNFMK